jgi:sugar phosphate isomerase/epimerase
MRTIREHRLEMVSVTTGRISYLLNVLNHPYADVRREGMRWCRRMVDLAAALGAPFVAGHFDYISQRELREREAECLRRLVDGMIELSRYAREKGLRGVCLEQMHGPHLRPYTIAEADRMLREINAAAALPVYLLADTGHMAHVPPQDMRHSAEDKDPYAWLRRRYADLDTIFVHTQQTDAQASRHWPFTQAYRDQGIIEPRRVIEAVERSGVTTAYLCFEILWGRGVPLDAIIRDIVETVEVFRRALREAGYRLDGRTQTWEKPATP